MNQLGKFNGVLLVSDFDDTLYGEDMRITRENVEALTYFTREGGTFTVATGRARPNFAPHASHIPINAPVILSNGSALYDFRTGEMIDETFLPDRVRRISSRWPGPFPPSALRPTTTTPSTSTSPTPSPNATWSGQALTAREVPIADIPLPWSKVILQQDYETLLHTQRYLLERWGEHYEVIFSNRVLLELTRKGSSKGGMVQYLARRLGIDAQHIYCVGDNQNDIPMLAVSAIPFAPANCAPEVKQWGARILGACEESCVAQIVDILDHIYA
ncbi:MAG: HAD-IIB family hydrolase [Flavonifractor plautii]